MKSKNKTEVILNFINKNNNIFKLIERAKNKNIQKYKNQTEFI